MVSHLINVRGHLKQDKSQSIHVHFFGEFKDLTLTDLVIVN